MKSKQFVTLYKLGQILGITNRGKRLQNEQI